MTLPGPNAETTGYVSPTWFWFVGVELCLFVSVFSGLVRERRVTSVLELQSQPNQRMHMSGRGPPGPIERLRPRRARVR
jgi:hypothetical protein